MYTTSHEGEFGTSEYRLYFLESKNGKNIPISPFHDIPLWHNKDEIIVNMIVEIPKGKVDKLEISTKNFMNPIKHDIKDGKIRKVAIPYPANYGAIPQTWENPDLYSEDTQAYGDNDPLDIFDISSIEGNIGDVKQVKLFGAFAMIDEGETDWKLIGIDINDPDIDNIKDLTDVDIYFPNKLAEIYNFLRDYKIPDGKLPNKFAFDGKLLNCNYARDIINDTHAEWTKLINLQLDTDKSKQISTHMSNR